ncbi:hypothetical protein L6452_12212 [Arctium lappa]|uniref:Uncharacterized protein n=1 Tax=Arctium lappa TaxID=4217 RepID=A0ACB9DQK9_ARCLA|nr:hypothetical protein L6452_12212 [Arctium lappa]
MPTYLKFMKDILSKKRKIEDHATIALTEECSAIIQNKLPPKLQDPGSFSIPVQIGVFHFDKVLCDLGASINLLPLSIFRKLGLGEVKPTNMTLQLADRSVKYPYGIVEDVLIKVGKFYFPVDFVVLDMEEDVDVPLILGRPFLATSKALIDMEEGVMTFRVGNEKVTFHVLKSVEDRAELERRSIGSEMGDDEKTDVSRDSEKFPRDKEVSMAKYIVQQYIAATGGERALNSVDNMFAVGKVKMVASEFIASDGISMNCNGLSLGGSVMKLESVRNNGGGEMGGFVLWQKRPNLWSLELVVSGCKISADSDGGGGGMTGNGRDRDVVEGGGME